MPDRLKAEYGDSPDDPRQPTGATSKALLIAPLENVANGRWKST